MVEFCKKKKNTLIKKYKKEHHNICGVLRTQQKDKYKMNNINKKSNYLNSKRRSYYSGVALMALMYASSVSHAMEGDKIDELSRIPAKKIVRAPNDEMYRISCLWHLGKEVFRASALNILEKKILEGSFQTNSQARVKYIKKLSEFLKNNPQHSLTLEILQPGEKDGDSPLSKFYQKTLAIIAQSKSLSDIEKDLQIFKLKIFHSQLPKELNQLDSECLENIKNEINETSTNLLINRQITMNKKDYFDNFYPIGNPEITEQRLKRRGSLAMECQDPLLKGKINFKLALSKIDIHKKLSWLNQSDYPLAQYYLAELYNSTNKRGEALALYASIVNNEDLLQNKDLLKVYPLAAYKLAEFYKNGLKYDDFHLKPNPKKAFEYLKLAAMQGHPYAQYELAKYRFEDNNDVHTGFKLLEQSAEAGYFKAQLDLAEKYENGYLIEKNSELALSWYLKAAGQEEGGAANYPLGYAYEKINDYEKAVSFYEKSKDPRAQVRLGKMYLKGKQKNVDLALQHFSKAAAEGNSDGKYCLGLMHQRGQGLPAPKLEDAFENFTAAAEQKHSKALFRLGIMKQFGIGTNQNYTEAKDFYEKSGISVASYYLGGLYKKGLGIQKNTVEALKLWEKAATLGHKEASYKAGKMHLKLWYQRKSEEEEEKAHFYLKQVSKLAHASYWLACLYQKKMNPSKALIYYTQAAEAGHAAAQFELGKFYDAIIESDSKIKFLDYYKRAAQQGHAKACYTLANNHPKKNSPGEVFSYLNNSRFIPLMKQLAQSGQEDAIKLVEDEAYNDNPQAQLYLGKLLETGVKVEGKVRLAQNISRAINWYIKAARHGNYQAQRRLTKFKKAYLIEALPIKPTATANHFLQPHSIKPNDQDAIGSFQKKKVAYAREKISHHISVLHEQEKVDSNSIKQPLSSTKHFREQGNNNEKLENIDQRNSPNNLIVSKYINAIEQHIEEGNYKVIELLEKDLQNNLNKQEDVDLAVRLEQSPY